jgi:hypothetical protein
VKREEQKQTPKEQIIVKQKETIESHPQQPEAAKTKSSQHKHVSFDTPSQKDIPKSKSEGQSNQKKGGN